MSPEIKIIAVSNVYSRLMHFVKAGDIELGHCHTFDHATLVSSGSVLYEELDKHDGVTVKSKVVPAPNLVFVGKEKFHRITALEDNTVCACIHALRTIDNDLIDPDFLMEQVVNYGGEIDYLVKKKTGKLKDPLIHVNPPTNET